MKKYKLIIISSIIFLIIFSGKMVCATDESNTQKFLYQDININTDGSITVKEAICLNGEYNGGNREIKLKSKESYSFTGNDSNFNENTDIYEGTEITDIKVFDISQDKFKTIDDINNIEKEFKKVEKASKGDYGVYTISESMYGLNVTIYCPSKKKKVFYLEYTIKDAVVVHNDIAEIYWKFVENESLDTILDYKAVVHLPNDDNNIMVWSHGSDTAKCQIIDYRTVSLTDSNIIPNKKETLRIMFDKSLVPNATKVTNVDGKQYIMQYEDYIRLQKEINIETSINKVFNELSNYPSILSYYEAKELIEKITWDNELQKKYEIILETKKEDVNKNWKENIENDMDNMERLNLLSESGIDNVIDKIERGFDKEAKIELYKKVNELQHKLNNKKIKIKETILKIVVILYCILVIGWFIVIVKVYFEKKTYKQKYYRDFPNDDNAYIIDYLVHKKVTSRTFSATILELIEKKKIKLEKNSSGDDFYFILEENDFKATTTQKNIIDLLFNVVGKNNRCSLNSLKNCKKSDLNYYSIIDYFRVFRNNVLKEIENKEYFIKESISNKILKSIPIIIYLIILVLGFFISNNGHISILNYYILFMIFTILNYKILSLYKRRTEKGKLEYSKWLAHKRFLEDFSNFSEKEVSEITLWDKYFVTATALGCSDKVLKQMDIYINNINNIYQEESTSKILHDYISFPTIKEFDHNIDYFISKSRKTSDMNNYSSNNDSDIDSGFDSGSSSGGRRRWLESFLKYNYN